MGFRPRLVVGEDRDMQTCTECGAVAAVPCRELFERLLALDHSRQEPWGPLHGVVVACYRLQHPAALPARDRGPALDLIHQYERGGLDALQRWAAHARRANSHRLTGGRDRPFGDTRPASTADGSRTRPDTDAATGDSYAVTIADVAVDGTFPAAGHRRRVRSWARATLATWGG